MRSWSQLFNPRQLLTLLIYIEIINEAKVLIQAEYECKKAEAIATYLSLVLDRCADANCRMVIYNASRACIQKASTQHTLNLMWNYPEVNGADELWKACQEEAAEDCRVRRNTSPCPPPLRTGLDTFASSGSSLLLSSVKVLMASLV